jgi:hypothetical protein
LASLLAGDDAQARGVKEIEDPQQVHNLNPDLLMAEEQGLPLALDWSHNQTGQGN